MCQYNIHSVCGVWWCSAHVRFLLDFLANINCVLQRIWWKSSQSLSLSPSHCYVVHSFVSFINRDAICDMWYDWMKRERERECVSVLLLLTSCKFTLASMNHTDYIYVKRAPLFVKPQSNTMSIHLLIKCIQEKVAAEAAAAVASNE